MTRRVTKIARLVFLFCTVFNASLSSAANIYFICLPDVFRPFAALQHDRRAT